MDNMNIEQYKSDCERWLGQIAMLNDIAHILENKLFPIELYRETHTKHYINTYRTLGRRCLPGQCSAGHFVLLKQLNILRQLNALRQPIGCLLHRPVVHLQRIQHSILFYSSNENTNQTICAKANGMSVENFAQPAKQVICMREFVFAREMDNCKIV